MATYTHWRLRCGLGAGSTYVQLGEMTLLGAGGTDLSVGGTPSASSTFSGSFPASNAFDKNDVTEWATAAGDTDIWIQYALGAGVDVAKLSIRFAASSSYLPSGIRLEAANSGSGPWTAFVLAGLSLVAATTRIYEVLPGPQPAVQHMLPTSVELVAPTVFLPLAAVDHKLLKSRDFVHGGPGRIYGNVFKKGTPANFPAIARVRLQRDVDSLAIRETWSNSAGAYEFTDLSLDYKYSATARDHNHDYRAVIADNLTPEVAP
ncbi:discoidin domain-containing protein [Acidovorax sp. LjRoot118]|uniref:discoidin domain-containing protein n=1 Tax=Acidovorax sp. LjRoot118 TaxID=3342256 RepID=UPI003ECFBCAD